MRRSLLGVMTVGAVIFGLCLILVAVTLGRCDAFGGRCPADDPPLFEDDVFGMAAFGAFLLVAVPYFLYRPSKRQLLVAVSIGVAAGLMVGLIARSSVP
jgi:hypothetical protein